MFTVADADRIINFPIHIAIAPEHQAQIPASLATRTTRKLAGKQTCAQYDADKVKPKSAVATYYSVDYHEPIILHSCGDPA